MDLYSLPTPALVVDRTIVASNCAAMSRRATDVGVALRPHMKTGKAAEIAAFATSGQSGAITVSTPAEAEFFAASGYDDITYAVSMSSQKLHRFSALERSGCRITLITDSLDAVRSVEAEAATLGSSHRVLIEIDTGGGRSGVDAASDVLLELTHAIHDSPHLDLGGVLTHAGHSYHCSDVAGVVAVAEEERWGVVRAAETHSRNVAAL